MNQMIDQKTETQPLPKMLRISEVASALQIYRTVAYRLCQFGGLRSVRFGNTVRVLQSDLLEFINKHHSHQ
jgi:excisionase family DNA binding protein